MFKLHKLHICVFINGDIICFFQIDLQNAAYKVDF